MKSLNLFKLIPLLAFFILISCSTDSESEEAEPQKNAIIKISSGSSIDFGEIIEGEEVRASLQIKNTGDADLIISNFTKPAYATLDISSATVVPNQNIEITITLKPTEVKEYNDVITINSNASSGGSSISIKGRSINKIFTGDVHLKSQQEVEDFGANNYFGIQGNLFIGLESGDTNINDLNSLNSLTRVSGNLIIKRNSALTAINEFENFVSLGGNLYISTNGLVNINGFKMLESIHGNLDLTGNNDLTSFNGFKNLNEIGGWLTINSNNALQNLDDFINLNYIGSNIFIIGNSSLQNLKGLKNINSEINYLNVSFTTSLANLEGLENITSIEILEVAGNIGLNTFTGLNNLKSVSGNFIIQNNSNLDNLIGLENLTSLGASLVISNNIKLTNLDGANNLISINGSLNIDNNPVLVNYCGIRQLIKSGTISESKYLVYANKYNPSFSKIQESGNSFCEE